MEIQIHELCQLVTNSIIDLGVSTFNKKQQLDLQGTYKTIIMPTMELKESNKNN